MTLAIICFIFFLISAIFFISSGYRTYKKTNDFDELQASCLFAFISLSGCLISGIRIYIELYKLDL